MWRQFVTKVLVPARDYTSRLLKPDTPPPVPTISNSSATSVSTVRRTKLSSRQRREFSNGCATTFPSDAPKAESFTTTSKSIEETGRSSSSQCACFHGKVIKDSVILLSETFQRAMASKRGSKRRSDSRAGATNEKTG